jgi:hypothetical protein
MKITPGKIIATVVALLFSGAFLGEGVRTSQRSMQIDSSPSTIDLRQFLSGAPPANRHLTISACHCGQRYGLNLNKDSYHWNYFLIPVYPHGTSESTGENIRFVAKVQSIQNIRQLKQFLQSKTVTGFAWGGIPDITDHNLLSAKYPRLDRAKYRVIEVGYPAPTQQAARQWKIAGATLLSLVALAWIFAWRRGATHFPRDTPLGLTQRAMTS